MYLQGYIRLATATSI